MAKHYKIVNNVVFANVPKLTDSEMKEVQRYQSLGFTVQAWEGEKKEAVKRLDNNSIVEYLKENDKEAIAIYEAKKNEDVRDEEGNIKYHIIENSNGEQKLGKPYKAGFNAGRNWFATHYPADVDIALKAIKEAGLEKDLEKSWKKYEEKDTAVKKMNKEAYTRDYYWKKVFVRK